MNSPGTVFGIRQRHWSRGLPAGLLAALLSSGCAEDSADLGNSFGGSISYARSAPPEQLNEASLPLKSPWKLVEGAERIQGVYALEGKTAWIERRYRLDTIELKQCKISGCRDSLATVDTWTEQDTTGYDAVANGQLFRLSWRPEPAEIAFCPHWDCTEPTPLWKSSSLPQGYAPSIIGATETSVLFSTGSPGLKFCQLDDCLGTLIELPDLPTSTQGLPVNVQAEAYDDRYVYLGGTDGIYRMKLDGTGVAEPITPAEPRFGRMVLSSDTLYWTETTALGSVKSCPKTGCLGAPIVLMSALNHPVELIVDNSHIYVMEPCYTQDTLKGDRLLRCPLEGCDQPTVLTENVGSGDGLTQDADHVYFVGSPTCNCMSSPSCSFKPGDNYVAVIPK